MCFGKQLDLYGVLSVYVLKRALKCYTGDSDFTSRLCESNSQPYSLQFYEGTSNKCFLLENLNDM